MTRTPHRAVRLGAIPAIIGIGLLASVAPADAATSGSNAAYGLEATGLVAGGPLASSTYPAGPTTDSVASASVGSLVSTGVINTTATDTTASANTADPGVTLSTLTAATLKATAVKASCSFDASTGALTGTASIAGGSVTLLGVPTKLAGAPAPNTTVSVAGVATITLNSQVTNADGSLTVDAISVKLLGSTQTLVISSATCQAATLLATPLVAAPIGAGAAGVAAVGGGLWLLLRRRHVVGPAL